RLTVRLANRELDPHHQSIRLPGSHRVFRTGIHHLVPDIGELIADEQQCGGDVDQRHRFELAIVAQEREHGFQHRAHLVEVAQHMAAVNLIGDEFGAQPKPRDRGAQIVADRGEHLGAVVDQRGAGGPGGAHGAHHGHHGGPGGSSSTNSSSITGSAGSSSDTSSADDILQQFLQSLQDSLSSSSQNSYSATGSAASDGGSSFSALLINYQT